MNKPYQKEYKKEIINEDGIDYEYTYDEVINPITKDKPYLHTQRSVRGKSKQQYQAIHNHVTGEFMMKLRLYGNNRANTCSIKRRNKQKHSRQHMS